MPGQGPCSLKGLELWNFASLGLLGTAAVGRGLPASALGVLRVEGFGFWSTAECKTMCCLKLHLGASMLSAGVGKIPDRTGAFPAKIRKPKRRRQCYCQVCKGAQPGFQNPRTKNMLLPPEP